MKKLIIRMDRSYTEFIAKDLKGEFLSDLSFITGVPEDQILNVQFRKGCVIFEGEIDEEALKRLMESYRKRNCNVNSEEISNLNDFIAKYVVVEMTDDLKIRVSVKTDKKGKPKIIFVHGWRGGPKSFGEIPSFLSDLTGCGYLIYNYPTGIWEKSPSIQYISRNLDNWIRNYTANSSLAIICHSMGGIVTRKLVASQAWRTNRLDCHIKQITFIASPHSGVPLAKLGRHVPTIQKAQISDLSTKSPFLVDLNNQWAAWSKRNVPSNCATRSIYGTADDVVDETLALGDDPEAIPILGAGHIDIVKPKDRDAEIVVTLNRLLRESTFLEHENA